MLGGSEVSSSWTGGLGMAGVAGAGSCEGEGGLDAAMLGATARWSRDRGEMTRGRCHAHPGAQSAP